MAEDVGVTGTAFADPSEISVTVSGGPSNYKITVSGMSQSGDVIVDLLNACVDPVTVEWGDLTSPTNPALESPSHAPSVPSSDASVSIHAHGAADDDSGVAGFEVAWTQDAAWMPTGTITHPADWESGVFEASSDGSWWLCLATVDGAGNWSEPVCEGPFVIDTTSPTATVSPVGSATTATAPLVFSARFNEEVSSLLSTYVDVTNGSVDWISLEA